MLIADALVDTAFVEARTTGFEQARAAVMAHWPERVERLTGVQMVLNTSFNVRGEPIVHHPEQAVECFLKTGMDALFLGDYLLTKSPESAARRLSAEELVAAHATAAAADNQVG